MIYFLYGADSYRSKRKLKEIIEEYKSVHKSGLNLINIDAAGSDFKDFSSSINIMSMFAEKKLVILKNVFTNAKFAQELLDALEDLEESKDIVVIYEEGEPDKRMKLFKNLEDQAKSQEFTKLTPLQLNKWVAGEFAAKKAKINSSATALLINFVGSDLWRMANEIDKLSAYKPVIEKEDVELLVRASIENDIFKTIDALVSKNKKYALSLLHKHLEDGDEPLYLLSMIAYQFRNLLIIKELQDKHEDYGSILKKSGLHPFVARKSGDLCRHFPMEQLKKIFQKIFQIDSNVKIGKIDPETALDLLLSEI